MKIKKAILRYGDYAIPIILGLITVSLFLYKIVNDTQKTANTTQEEYYKQLNNK